MALILYHGTSVGWLTTTGLSIPSRSYGESKPPHKFIYLCTNRNGAESAAYTAERHCINRIKNESSDTNLSRSDFSKNLCCIPARYVYEFLFTSENSIDASLENISPEQEEKILNAIRSIHKMKKKRLIEYYCRLILYKFCKWDLQCWMKFVEKTYLTGPAADRKVEIFRIAGFQLVRNFEKDIISNYGETIALILKNKKIVPHKVTLI